MKRFMKFLFMAIAVVLFISVLFFTSCTGEGTPTASVDTKIESEAETYIEQDEMSERSVSNLPYYFFPAAASSYVEDTITNTSADTTLIPTNLLSNWFYGYSVTTNNISGTSSVIVVVQESIDAGAISGAGSVGQNVFNWVEVARDTVTGSSTKFVTGSAATGLNKVRGVKQRVIRTGLGTQSTRTRIKFIAKKD